MYKEMAVFCQAHIFANLRQKCRFCACLFWEHNFQPSSVHFQPFLVHKARRSGQIWSGLVADMTDIYMTNTIGMTQTWNLSKILHRRIFRIKILHRQLHLILTVLVRKNTNMSENGEIYTAGRNFTLPPALTALTNSTSGMTPSHLPFNIAWKAGWHNL